ncbi:site-2 protease family protein [Clostridium tagluense]|uniref:site-2 protease family protein n=1 Tax=Clostridium tagluense TaxID=360422 RepID=UPI001CF151A8|nr:site-2 protease family protein [Clostridium tagluense]MCB2299569.1 site-2 protease family protein [Clostridium tagluense]
MANAENLTKRKKVLSILFSVFTVLLTILVIGVVFNIYFSIGYLFILIVHELGHYIGAKFLNIKIIFGGLTPFGAYIIHDDIKSCKENALVAIAGPLFGGILALIYYLIYHFTGNSTFFVLSFVSVSINLLNLIPVQPFDGAYVAEIISPIISYIGLIFLLFIVITSKHKLLWVILLVIGMGKTYELREKYYKDNYFRVERNTKVKYITYYGTLLLLLGFSTLYFYQFSNLQALIIDILRFKG